MLIMVYECLTLLLTSSLILKEDKAQNSFLLLLLIRAQAFISFRLANTLVIVCQELFLETVCERKRYLMRGFAY
jgi:hypothetical protein